MSLRSGLHLGALMCLLAPLFLATAAWACAPSGDLWFMAKEADRILVFDTESVRRVDTAPLSWLTRATGSILAAVESVDRDLHGVIVDALPDIDFERYSFVSDGWAVGEIGPGGFEEHGQRMSLKSDGWTFPPMPGTRSIIFQQSSFGGLRWLTVPLVGSVLPVREDQDLDELVRAISLARRLPDGPPPESWNHLAMSLPAARIFAEFREPIHLDDLVGPLVEHPSGSMRDLWLLDAMVDIEDPRLDELAVAWIEVGVAREDYRMASLAATIALERFGIVEHSGSTHARFHTDDFPKAWHLLESQVDLPDVDSSRLADIVDQREEFLDQWMRQWEEFTELAES